MLGAWMDPNTSPARNRGMEDAPAGAPQPGRTQGAGVAQSIQPMATDRHLLCRVGRSGQAVADTYMHQVLPESRNALDP
jgi:hypothetical protein